ncbi:MAG: metallophosphoesterase [Gemmatimonadota bacterium]
MRLAWLTDLHLNGIPPGKIEELHAELLAEDPDVVLVGGDIGNADTFPSLLKGMEERFQRPIFFVLGNHDFYGGRLADGRRIAAEMSKGSPWLRWLPEVGLVELTDQTGLLGHGSWADGRFGSGIGSMVLLNDYLLIRDFISLNQGKRFEKLNSMGDEAAGFFERILPSAVKRFRRLILLTHVPPFREATWHEGRVSDDDWLPHFSCKAVGEVLVRIMVGHPGCHLTVLCGHTHGEGEVRILENLLVKTGGAVYGKPKIQGILDVP